MRGNCPGAGFCTVQLPKAVLWAAAGGLTGVSQPATEVPFANPNDSPNSPDQGLLHNF